MEAVVLVGGLGTRLKKVVGNVPKPLAPIAGRPFLYFLLKELEYNKVDSVILAAGYGSDQIVDFCKTNSFDFKLKVSEERDPLGTGGALRHALMNCQAEHVFTLNGDTYFPINLNGLLSFHKSKHFSFTMALKQVEDVSRYGSILLKNGVVSEFLEKSNETHAGLINGGVAVLDRMAFLTKTKEAPFSLENDFLKNHFREGTFGGKEFLDPFIDMGIPEDYAKAQTLIPKWFQERR